MSQAHSEQAHSEVAALKAAMQKAREFALKHGVGLRDFSAACGVSPTTMSQWTSTLLNQKPDIVCKRRGVKLSGSGMKSDEDAEAEADEAIEQAERIISMTEDLPEEGEDFGMSVCEKCESIAEFIRKFRKVSKAQQEALDNMESGVAAWFHD